METPLCDAGSEISASNRFAAAAATATTIQKKGRVFAAKLFSVWN